MLRSKVVGDPETLDKALIDLQQQGCTIQEIHGLEFDGAAICVTDHNTAIPNNRLVKRNGFLIFYDDPYVYENMENKEEAIKTLKENWCAMCAYGSQDMDSCDIRSCDNRDAIKALERELNKSENEDLTNEQKFLRDWGRRPINANVVGSLAYQYICPAVTGMPIDQKAYDIKTGLCSAGPSNCNECAKRFWKSKYKKPEKKEE